MKVVFLDIDGVLCTPRCYAIASGTHAPAEPWCVKALNAITKLTGAVIVVSSSWRFGGLEWLRQVLKGWGVEAEVLDVTPRLNTPRGREIQTWLNCSPSPVESFVILDDDSDMEHLSDRLIQTNGAYGLDLRDAARAIEILEQHE